MLGLTENYGVKAMISKCDIVRLEMKPRWHRLFLILLSAKNGKVKRNLLIRWVGSTERPIRLAKTSTIDERDSLRSGEPRIL